MDPQLAGKAGKKGSEWSRADLRVVGLVPRGQSRPEDAGQPLMVSSINSFLESGDPTGQRTDPSALSTAVKSPWSSDML